MVKAVNVSIRVSIVMSLVAGALAYSVWGWTGVAVLVSYQVVMGFYLLKG